jgi:hypothetical protein
MGCPVGVVDPELRFAKTLRLRYGFLLKLEAGIVVLEVVVEFVGGFESPDEALRSTAGRFFEMAAPFFERRLGSRLKSTT